MKMLCLMIALACTSLTSTVAVAEDVKVEVEIKSIDPTARTITVFHNGKTTQLDFSRKVEVTIKGAPGEIESILPGDKATVVYHKELELVTKVDAEGSGKEAWKFWGIFDQDLKPDAAFVCANDGSLACFPSDGGWCLTNQQELSEFTFSIEFKFQSLEEGGHPFLSVLSTLPNPKSSDRKQKVPHGIEVQLSPSRLGELRLPSDNFICQPSLGQGREGRKVERSRNVAAKDDWNTLEVVVDNRGNMTVKINDITVNALSKVEANKGHILIFPSGRPMRFQNAVLHTGTDSKVSIPFDEVMSE
ncbi:MAG: family 16 glycoside hydrolase [Planctomycetaceae bacterium]